MSRDMAKRPTKKKHGKKHSKKRGPKGPDTRIPRPDPQSFREMERLINEIQRDAHEQRQSGSEQYVYPYTLLGRLLFTSLPNVPEDLGEFVVQTLQVVEAIKPECMATQGIRNMLESSDPSGIMRLFRESRWQSFGCPVIEVGAEMAATMMTTNFPNLDGLEEILPPWDAFLIALPEGLIEYNGIHYTDVLVHRYQSPAPLPLPKGMPADVRRTAEKIASFMDERKGVMWGLYGMSGSRGYLQGEALLAEHLGLSPRVSLVAPQLPIGDPGEGILALFARLTVGLCVAVDRDDALTETSEVGALAKVHTLNYRPTRPDADETVKMIKAYVHGLKDGYSSPPIVTDLNDYLVGTEIDDDDDDEEHDDSEEGAKGELRGGDGIFAHRPKNPPRDPNRRRPKPVKSTDDDPLFPFEEYIEAKYNGQNPYEIRNALVALEDDGLEKAAKATGHSQDWIEGWAKLYGSEHVLQDIDFSDPYRRAMLELVKLHPEEFRDLWEDEEAAQPELEAIPGGRQNTILVGFPFVRGRVETPELAADREVSRKIRAVRQVRRLRVIK